MNIGIGGRRPRTEKVLGLFSVEDQPGAGGGRSDGRIAARWPRPRREHDLDRRRPDWEQPGCGAAELDSVYR